jgi:hypothetical protein
VGLAEETSADDLPPARRNVPDQLFGLREQVFVPREVPLAVGVLDVEPEHVVLVFFLFFEKNKLSFSGLIRVKIYMQMH